MNLSFGKSKGSNKLSQLAGHSIKNSRRISKFAISLVEKIRNDFEKVSKGQF